MHKTLYISDLDGTLLNSNAGLSDYTVNTINHLIGKGMYFTFATARTIYSAKPITRRLEVNVPCILNNGAGVYDIPSGTYVKKACIPINTARQIISAFRKNNVRCFLFEFVDGVLTTCYDNITEELMRNYVEERKGKFLQPFIECDDVLTVLDNSAIYINSTGDYESLLPVRNEVLKIDGADCAFYKDTYTEKWYLETFSADASKANGIKFLREKYGFDRVVAFGDNLNDLSMFSQADVKIAVENAHPDVKAAADLVIDTNDNNGVAEYLYKIFQNR